MRFCKDKFTLKAWNSFQSLHCPTMGIVRLYERQVSLRDPRVTSKQKKGPFSTPLPKITSE